MLDQAFRHEVWTRLEPALRQSPTIDSYLQAAADMTADVIEVVGSYSFSTSLYGNLITVASSDRAAWEADQVEFDTEDGPCVEALRTGTVFKAIDLAEDRRWPAWSAVATLLGFSSAAGIPAEVSPGQRIALNLYALRTPGVRRRDAAPGDPIRRGGGAHHPGGCTALRGRRAGLAAGTGPGQSINHRPGPRRAHGPEPVHPRHRVRHPAPRISKSEREAPRRRSHDHRALHRPSGGPPAALPADYTAAVGAE